MSGEQEDHDRYFEEQEKDRLIAKLQAENEKLRVIIKKREDHVVRLLKICTKLLGELTSALPKRIRYRHHDELIDEANTELAAALKGE